MTTAATSVLTIQVLLFGSYAEWLGRETLELRLPGPATIADVVARLRWQPGGERLPVRPLCALNLTQVPNETPVMDGDELAVLPPLAGG